MILNIIFSVLFAICLTFSNNAVADDAEKHVSDYISNYAAFAVKEMHRTGIPASITIAQGMLESSFGRSELAQGANNHFGVKCHKGWAGETYFIDTDEYFTAEKEVVYACFRSYETAEGSFRDHSNFLTSRAHYTQLFQLPATDYVAWANGLYEAGYATDPNYAAKLISLIERYDLHTFDLEAKTSQNEAVAQNETNTDDRLQNRVVELENVLIDAEIEKKELLKSQALLQQQIELLKEKQALLEQQLQEKKSL